MCITASSGGFFSRLLAVVDWHSVTPEINYRNNPTFERAFRRFAEFNRSSFPHGRLSRRTMEPRAQGHCPR